MINSLVDNAGYPVQFSEQFSNIREHTRLENGFSATQDKQKKAYEILGHALSDRSSYVDPETGDNVLHALAKLKLPEKGSLLQKVKHFASKNVDLNLHNRDRHSPLAAFIQERPCLGPENEETGATLSKYLDALLWKDTRHRVPNRINVNMRNRAGATALYYAAIRARPDSVRSLIEAGANVNARLNVNGYSQSILQATFNARSGYVNDAVKLHLYKEVVSYLQHEGAVPDPTIFQERGFCANSVRLMPL
jgi:ankyrin repeat protein